MKIFLLHPRAAELIGFIPSFLHEDDPRPAKEQFNERYVAGWQPFHGGFKVDKNLTISYPGDPPLKPVALIQFRKETIAVYDHAWVMVVQPDGTNEIMRMD